MLAAAFGLCCSDKVICMVNKIVQQGMRGREQGTTNTCPFRTGFCFTEKRLSSIRQEAVRSRRLDVSVK